MMPSDDWAFVVAAAHVTGTDAQSEHGVTVRSIRGGANNALYRVDVEGQSFACKLCVDDERRRAACEYGALDLLRRAGLDLAPQPLWLDETCRLFPYPAVAYVWLRGEPIYPPLTAEQLAALLATVQSSHSLRVREFPDHRLRAAWFHGFEFGVYLAEMTDFIDDYGPWLVTSDPDGSALLDRLTQAVFACARTIDAPTTIRLSTRGCECGIASSLHAGCC